MELITKVEYDKAPFKISHLSKSLLLGSCFAENIGCLMRENKFDCDVNPFWYSIQSAICVESS